MIDWVALGRIAYDLVLAVTGLAVWRWGSLNEQLAIIVIIGGSGLSALAHGLARPLFGIEVVWALMPIDLAVLLAFDMIMVRTRASWPIFVEGFQLAGVTIGICQMIWPTAARPYLWIEGKFAYLMLGAILIGMWHRMRSSRAHDPK